MEYRYPPPVHLDDPLTLGASVLLHGHQWRYVGILVDQNPHRILLTAVSRAPYGSSETELQRNLSLFTCHYDHPVSFERAQVHLLTLWKHPLPYPIPGAR